MRGDRGAISIAVAVVAAALVTVGAGLGVVLDQAEVFGGPGDATVVRLDAVDVAVCPDGAVVGHLHRGDRVYATGRDAGGDWAEIRNPTALAQRVWIRAVYLVPDGNLRGLEVHPCTPPPAVTTTTTTTTTAPPEPVTTTTTTTRPGSAPVAPTAPGPVGPPPDTTGPSIGTATATPNTISELKGATPGCSNYPETATITVSVDDSSGVKSVSMSWDGAQGGTKAMSGSGTYTATIGPFTKSLASTGSKVVLTVSITATDNAGNSRTVASAVTVVVVDCT